ncbi:MAG TPA: Hsp70 family protein, partial [Vicinamibacterales bacterium]
EVDKMMKEAEAHAEEDRKRKEEIETRNHADQAAYQAEKMLKDAGDKLSASDKAPIESAIEDLKRAIEKNDTEEMKRTMEALNAAQHKAAEAMYRAANAGGAGAPGAGAAGGDQPGGATNGGGDKGDVIDAEVVEEEKK